MGSARAPRQPNAVAITEVGRRDDGVPYLVMDHLEGAPLPTGAAIDPGEVARIGAEVSAALSAAQAIGVLPGSR